jgi:hypothetical protein
VPVAYHRVIFALAAQLDWELHHVDIESAYLNATLDEEVYMTPPGGVLKPNKQGKVCKLRKALYGLKQAGREWYKTLATVILDMGYSRSNIDHSIFYCKTTHSHVIVAVATDDMAIARTLLSAINDSKSKIDHHFDISDMGELTWFLGFEVKCDCACRTISFNQRSYIQAMTEKFNLSNAKLTHLPALPGEILSRAQSPSNPEEREQMKNVPYAQAIGHVLWPVMILCPDAVFQVNLLAQFIQSPGRVHWNALKRLMCYLHTTRDLWLVIGGS